MEPFLKLVAQDLFSRYGDDLEKVNLVFPTRRAGLFFAKYLATMVAKPLWHPPVLSISDMMLKTSGYRLADQLSLVLELYKVYTRVMKSEESFDKFYFWGEVMLMDFDTVDKYRVDSSMLFRNIKAIKELEGKFDAVTDEQREALSAFIHLFEAEEKSEIRSRFLTIWDVLGSIFQEYKDHLHTQGLVYEGMAYRTAAEQFDSGSVAGLSEGTYAFIGFNALNDCEKSLFKYFRREDRALFYWDYDTYYTHDDVQEAGNFMRANMHLFPNAIGVQHFSNLKNERQITVVGSPTGVAQAKVIPALLSEIESKGGKLDENCAIVFPEEQYLMPVLRSLPSNLERLNITMGYPIRETPAFTLLDFLMKLQQGARPGGEEVRFYIRDVLSVLGHPYLSLVESDATQRLRKSLVDENRIYPKASSLHECALLASIFSPVTTGQQALQYLRGIVMSIAKSLAGLTQNETQSDSSRLDLEYLYALYQSITRLVDLLEAEKTEISLKVAGQLVRKVFSQQRVSFKGEPLAGLQLMGFLETRALDFKNLIILSMNDDALPGKHHNPTFITPSLRTAFGLPDYKHQEAIYAYYFYRLIQRSERIFLVYKNRTDGPQTGEVSRYILQLRMENGMTVEERSINFGLNLPEPVSMEVVKDDSIMEKLNTYLDETSDKYLSPSALTTYITCPLRFYYRYILGLKEIEEATEEVDSPLFGSILHQAMYQLLSGFVGKEISESQLATMAKDKGSISKAVDAAFRIEFMKGEKEGDLQLLGRNLIVKDVVESLVCKMLTLDAKRAPFTIVELEEKHTERISFPLNRKTPSVAIGGMVDRLEQADGTYVIIDYKTGAYKDKGIFSKVEDLFNPEYIGKQKEVFQTLLYSRVVNNRFPQSRVRPALWFVRQPDSDYRPGVFFKDMKNINPVTAFSDFEEEFNQNLGTLLGELFNEAVPFVQTAVADSCKNCTYKNVCAK